MIDLSSEAKNILVKIAKRVGHPIRPYNIYDIRKKALENNDKELISLINKWYKSEKAEVINTKGKESYKADWLNKPFGE